MTVHAHNDWADSVMEWAHENAAELKHFTGHREPWTEQHDNGALGDSNWIPVVVDRVREAYDPEDQSNSADSEVVLWLLKGMCVVGLALFCAWCIANYLAVARV